MNQREIDRLKKEAEEQEKRVADALERIEDARREWRSQLQIAIEKWKMYEEAAGCQMEEVE